MYAVIKAGGKQQRVKQGDVIEVERVPHPGETVTFHPILIVDDEGKTHFGKAVERALVTARPLQEQKGDKVKVFKYRPKTGYAKRQGHRQLMTVLEIDEVSLSPKRAASKKAEAKEAAGAEMLEKKPAARAPATTKAAKKADSADQAD